MPSKIIAPSLIKSFSEKQPIQTIDKMLDTCGCSLRTIRRKIKADALICSYNKNSIFYSVPAFAKFDQYGIWQHEQASFSKWGNLFETIVHLIDQSNMGLTSGELKSILNIRVYDPLRILCKKNRIKKIALQSQNIYFSTSDDIAQMQISTRNNFFKKEHKLPDPEIIIAILVEIVLDRKISYPKICNRLKKKSIKITADDIEAVIEHYQLKKKTYNSRRLMH